MERLVDEDPEEHLPLGGQVLVAAVLPPSQPVLARVFQRHVHPGVDPVDDDRDHRRPHLHRRVADTGH